MHFVVDGLEFGGFGEQKHFGLKFAQNGEVFGGNFGAGLFGEFFSTVVTSNKVSSIFMPKMGEINLRKIGKVIKRLQSPKIYETNGSTRK